MNQLAIKADFAGIRRRGAGQRFNQAGFACAVIADNRQNFTRIEIKIRIVQSNNLTIALGKTAPGENRFHIAHFELLRSH